MDFPKGNANPRITKKCEQCGESFRTRNPDKKYCDKTCRKSAENARQYQSEVDTGSLNLQLEGI